MNFKEWNVEQDIDYISATVGIGAYGVETDRVGQYNDWTVDSFSGWMPRGKSAVGQLHMTSPLGEKKEFKVRSLRD